MKSVLLFTLLGIATLGFCQSPTADTKVNFKKLEWLVGSWNRTNAKPGKSSNERWEKTGEFELRGIAVNMQGNDTTYIEKLLILIKDNSIYYVADVPENQKPIYFKFTQISNTGFVCENPSHDFPKKISYDRNGSNLKAQISGDGKSIDYLFKRN